MIVTKEVRFKRVYAREKLKADQRKQLKDLKDLNAVKWLWEFSKKLLVAVTIAFILAMLYAAVLMGYYCSLDYLGTWIDAWKEIMKDGIMFYGLKAGVENGIKIVCSTIERMADRQNVICETKETEEQEPPEERFGAERMDES